MTSTRLVHYDVDDSEKQLPRFHSILLPSSTPLHRRGLQLLSALAACAIVIFCLSAASFDYVRPREIAALSLVKAQGVFHSNSGDALSHFNQTDQCTFSSLDIHKASAGRRCANRQQLLEAMSGGGRIGFDAPYQTRECDMRWYSTSDICRILHKFDHIYMVGDSMMRQLVLSLNILIREDLVNGARKTWMGDAVSSSGTDCRCRNIFERGCWESAALDSDEIWRSDRASVQCPSNQKPASMTFHWLAQWPLEEEHIHNFTSRITNPDNANARSVFILGHGVWNSFVFKETRQWLHQIQDALRIAAPAYFETDPARRFPRLFISPNAQFEKKQALFATRQNNIMLQQFVHQAQPFLRSEGFDHLGTYNASIQTSSEDGTHANYETNLLKAMMVLNWLDSLEVPAR